MKTNYFTQEIDPRFQPYKEAFSRGVHLEHGKILKAYAMPRENEMLIVLDKTTTEARRDFVALAYDISDSFCVDFMPVVIDQARYKESMLYPDAIELEVNACHR